MPREYIVKTYTADHGKAPEWSSCLNLDADIVSWPIISHSVSGLLSHEHHCHARSSTAHMNPGSAVSGVMLLSTTPSLAVILILWVGRFVSNLAVVWTKCRPSVLKMQQQHTSSAFIQRAKTWTCLKLHTCLYECRLSLLRIQRQSLQMKFCLWATPSSPAWSKRATWSSLAAISSLDQRIHPYTSK